MLGKMTPRPILLAIVVLIVSCSSRDSDAALGSPAIEGTWVLSAVSVEGERLSLDPSLSTRAIEGVPAWIAFGGNGELTGEGPCNSLEGQYSLEGEVLDLAQVTAQATACVDSVGSTLIMDTEDAVFGPLLEPQASLSVSLSDATLVVSDSTTRLEFRRDG
ncbi:MAG: META domain-containing protein [Acidimicrobiia bacterium]|jgi:heat shock protein HslJ